jgi:hypothetical protein
VDKSTEIEVKVTVRQADGHSWENKTIASASRCESSIYNSLDAVALEVRRLCGETTGAVARQLSMTQEVVRLEEARRVSMLTNGGKPDAEPAS